MALAAPGVARAHAGAGADKRLGAVVRGGPVDLDGRPDEDAWRAAPESTDFIERKPSLRGVPPVKTSVRALFDERALYVAVRCDDDQALRADTLLRDSRALFADDALTLKIDPAHDHRNTYAFSVNPAGAKVDMLTVNETDFRMEWDAVWEVAVARSEAGWSAEYAIPWSVLGVDPASPPDTVGLALSRDHPRRNATYDWVLLPPPHTPMAASRFGHLDGLRELASLSDPGGDVLSVTPYALAGFEGAGGGGAGDLVGRAGADLAWRPAGPWRVYGTALTDFAQVDVDDQVVNLSRFSAFFPEKRDFFLEDLELMSFGRTGSAQLFHSRTIGLAGESQIPLAGGLKVVRDRGRGLRVAALNVVTLPEAGEPWTNHGVVRGMWELGGGANLGAMVTDRHALDGGDSNTAMGVDGQWRDQAFGVSDDQGALAGEGALRWRGEMVRPTLRFGGSDEALRTDLGYFRRTGVHWGRGDLQVEPRIGQLGLEKATLTAHGMGVAQASTSEWLDHAAGVEAELRWDGGLRAAARFEATRESVPAPFDVAPGVTIAEGVYDGTLAAAEVKTPGVHPLAADLEVSLGDFYGGRALTSSGGVFLKPGGHLRFEMEGVHSRVRFDDGLRPDFDATVVNLRGALGFTPTLGLSVYTAWNRQDDLLRAQARLRWTWSPGSDVFVVWQEDLDDDLGATGGPTLRQRSVQGKVTWRL